MLSKIFQKNGNTSINTKIPEQEFILALRFELSSTYFTFNNQIYKQTYNTPIGSPLSFIIADITLQDLELRALNTLTFNITFCYRYVDDIALAIPDNKLHEVLDLFNSFHHRTQFTYEMQSNGVLNFFDISITRQTMCWFVIGTISQHILVDI